MPSSQVKKASFSNRMMQHFQDLVQHQLRNKSPRTHIQHTTRFRQGLTVRQRRRCCCSPGRLNVRQRRRCCLCHRSSKRQRDLTSRSRHPGFRCSHPFVAEGQTHCQQEQLVALRGLHSAALPALRTWGSCAQSRRRTAPLLPGHC